MQFSQLVPVGNWVMYIFTTFKFPTHNSDFHLLTTSVNAKYYYMHKINVI